jgi:hypothetical protein
MSEEPLRSTTAAARALGISPRTLAQWAQQGRVRPDLVTAGGHYRWRVERLRQHLKDEYEQRLRDAEAADDQRHARGPAGGTAPDGTGASTGDEAAPGR